MKKSNVVKIIALVLFLGLAYYLSRQEFIAQYLSKQGLQDFVSSFGALGPLVYIAMYAIGICLFGPGTLFTAVGAVVFGTVWGFVYTIIAANIGATMAFYIARFLGKSFVDNMLKDKLKAMQKYNKHMEAKGFTTIYYLRMVFFPFTPLNFAAGLTKVKYKAYFWGTFLGIIPGTFIFTFFFDSITNISSWKDLFSAQILFAVSLFIVSFFIPFFIKKHKHRFIKG